MKIIISTFIVLASLSSFASGPTIEPGQPQNLDSKSTEAMNAMLDARPADLQKFLKAGNRITAVSVQNMAPGKSIYNITRQHCTPGGIVGKMCLGGASLQVVREEIRHGEVIETKTTSRVFLIR